MSDIIDLSQSIYESMPVYPGDEPVMLCSRKTVAENGYNEMYLCAGMHIGTHVDLPLHFCKKGETAAQIVPDEFVGNGVLLDVRGQAVIDFLPIYEGKIKENDIVLLLTDTPSDENYFTAHPVVSQRMCDFLLSKKIKMLGLDFPSPDYEPFSIHLQLLQGGIYIIENMTNLSALCGKKNFEIFAVPLKIKAEASPVRAFARISG